MHDALQRKHLPQDGKHIAHRVAAVQDHRQIKLFRELQLLTQYALLRRSVIAFVVIIQPDLTDRFDAFVLHQFPQAVGIIRWRIRTLRMHADCRDDQRRILFCQRDAVRRGRKIGAADHAADDALLREAAEQRVAVAVEGFVGVVRVTVKNRCRHADTALSRQFTDCS